MKIAIVHDWFVTYAGAEKVVEQMLEVFPEADLFSVVDHLGDNREFIKNKEVKTTFIQKLPFSKKKYRNYLPLMPLAIEQLDLSKYDVILSSSHAVAKGVLTGPDQLHISYVHSPIRYAWDLQHQYLKEANLEKGIKGFITKTILHKIRNWDYRTANGVDHFVGNSKFIGRRIWKVYRRESTVIYPPVDITAFTLHEQKEEFYVTASRMVPYKKIDLIVEAFASMPDKKLVVIGDGPDFEKVKSKAKGNVELLGYQSFEVLKDYMQRAKGFVFAAEEDFGITPVEAQACGTPVIAYGKGGAMETVLDLSHEKPTGLFFKEQTVESIVKAVDEFERNYDQFSSSNCRENSIRFSPERFKEELKNMVEERYKERFSK
ncbi:MULTISPECIES: glycosyltransferase family 4 protein [unclassified Bacillus (in: firmicutes)]|uniref:glycosyltransferase family 4 protein n=1 Tax=unclassified Bacillus (in: firmicutes) TaxID=185979 RepID=UPI0008E51966|nr:MULTISPECIES: glycosyltransferase family 4 protein [unclassified Bacillus (in: firmicutes)]SFJ64084.1 Glycosyltransferase involved in cell wall bisynthesis [Bacillus sp. 71mf]SFT13604.1 Glycosyltransferase involved in cell wall bisynthesis [Bacillus sp. 103mf]